MIHTWHFQSNSNFVPLVTSHTDCPLHNISLGVWPLLFLHAYSETIVTVSFLDSLGTRLYLGHDTDDADPFTESETVLEDC